MQPSSFHVSFRPERGRPSATQMTTSLSNTSETGPDLPGPGQSVDVSVVIVNYNVRDFLVQAIRSVKKASRNLVTDIWVVDNNSIDDSVETVAREFPDVHLIANTENAGFGVANNQAIRQCAGEYVLILNPDTIVQEDTLDTMVAFARGHSDCGALGCRILNPDGSFAPESRRAFPTPKIAFWRMTGLGKLFPGSKRFGGYNMTYLPIDEAAEVDALSGSCMLVRREALIGPRGAGLFDEDFFMYGEDLDLCYRIQQSGWSIWYTPDTCIIHYKGESTKKGEIRYVRLFYGAMLLFIEKHLDRQHSTLLASLLRFGIMLRAFITLMANGFKRLLPPALDLVGVFAATVAMGVLRYEQTGTTFTSLFVATVAPALALISVLGIAISGGYKRPRHYPFLPVFSGLLVGFLVVSSLSFFVQQIAFSRFALLASLPLSALLLSSWRLVLSRKRLSGRTAILVGGPKEADRLARLMAAHPRPEFKLTGYVFEDEEGQPASRVRRVGRPSGLRDLVRIRGYNDIVFAAGDVSNQVIIRHMQALRDLDVQFRILSAGGDHIIGKATINHLASGSLSGGPPQVVKLRTPAARRFFDWTAGTALTLLFPALWLASRFTSRHSGLRRGVARLRGLPSVFSGAKSLVGTSEDTQELIPDVWGMHAGLFPVSNSLSPDELEEEDILRTAWHYLTHQSPALDAAIILSGFSPERAPESD